MISSGAEPWWYLGWIAAFALVLVWLAPRLRHRRAGGLVVMEGLLLAGLFVGDVAFGMAHTWWFNSLLLSGTLVVLGLFLAALSLQPGLDGERHQAAVSLRLPAAMFLVVGVWVVWITVPH